MTFLSFTPSSCAPLLPLKSYNAWKAVQTIKLNHFISSSMKCKSDFFLKSKCVSQLTWAYKHILLKLHFHLTILISSRKLSIKLIIAIIYVISSSLFIEASMRIHQLKGMIHILTTIIKKITKTTFFFPSY